MINIPSATGSAVENKVCHVCSVTLINDESGALVGVNENDVLSCYKCHFKEEDEAQVKKDDAEMIAKGYVELPDGRWIKNKSRPTRRPKK